jgi:uncharacterized membrane protein
MKKVVRDNAAVAAVFVILTLALWNEDEIEAAPRFLAFMLLTYGSGMLLWSDNLMRERKAWFALAIGLVLATVFSLGTVWLYIGMVFVLQLVAFLVVHLILRFRKLNGREE